MKSIWQKEMDIPARPRLDGDISADIAIIGAGMAGILTGYFLQKQGFDVVILEAKTIGGGQTANTSAKITSQHNLIYHSLIQELGEDKARQYAQANQEAICHYEDLIRKENIDCCFRRQPAYLYSLKDRQILEDEAQAALKLGIDAHFTTETTLPFPIVGATCFNQQASFQPLQFLAKISQDLQIYEHTMVKKLDEQSLITAQGRSVKANKIVFACHYPFLNVPGYYFMRMHQERAYFLALAKAQDLDGMYIGIEKEAYSLRNYGDLLLLGGSSHRTGENDWQEGAYPRLRKAAQEFYPLSQEVASWSAQDCMTLDGIPYIGYFSAARDDIYVATGFGKWGMTSSMVAARIISDLIMGQDNPYSEVFSPQRFKFSSSVDNILSDGLEAAKAFSKEFWPAAAQELEDLPCGYGGIMEYNGEKAGIYKDEKGKIFAISPVCSHLGCQLVWNADELSWDCPCHGSRFDYRGHLLADPALDDLEALEDSEDSMDE